VTGDDTPEVPDRPLARGRFVDAFPIAVILFDREGRYLDLNKAASRLIGRTRSELLGRANWEIFPDTRDQAFHRAFLEVTTARARTTVESYYEAWDRWYEATLVPVDSSVLCSLEDTTDRKRADARLAKLNQRLRSLITQAPIPVAVWEGPEHRCSMYNPAYDALVGGRLREGATIRELFPELVGHPSLERLDRVFATGEDDVAPEEHIPLSAPDGTIEDRWFSTSWRAIRDESDTITGIIAVGIEVTQQVRAREAVAASRAAAEAASRAKDEFLAMLGHELRNPLAPIRTATELMRLRPNGPHERPLEVIERQTTHLMRLVDDLLDVSRITRGEISLSKTRVDVAELIAQSIEVSLPLIEQREHQLEVRVEHGLIVHGDRDRLVQVFSNLLTNAAKYTQPGGHIAVHGALAGDEIHVRVRDDGKGISPELLPHVFDVFVQGDQNRARPEGGIGLGLAIVRNLVEQHGGRASARSDGLGRGSEFTVVLPVAPLP
jgi:PAS domain S-box-containing protein